MENKKKAVTKPGEFWILVYMYGHNDVRVEVDLRVRASDPGSFDKSAEHREALFRLALDLVSRDLKHSFNMKCMNCGASSRESFTCIESSMHLPPRGELYKGKRSPGPFAMVFNPAVCTMKSDCGFLVKQKMVNQIHKVPNATSIYEGDDVTMLRGKSEHARAAACAGCGQNPRDNNGKRKPMKKCSACHMPRYCSHRCQKKAWASHKIVCHWFAGARVIEKDQVVKTWKDIDQEEKPEEALTAGNTGF